MSKWTHFAGVVRLDHIPLRGPLEADQVLDLFRDGQPRGTEGPLQFSVDTTQKLDLDSGGRVRSMGVVWGTVMIAGDLRDWDGEAESEKILSWLNSRAELLKIRCALIRQAVVEAETEGGPTDVYVWNQEANKFLRAQSVPKALMSMLRQQLVPCTLTTRKQLPGANPKTTVGEGWLNEL